MKNEDFLPPVLISHLKGVSTLKNLRDDALKLKQHLKSAGNCVMYMCHSIFDVTTNKRAAIFCNVINKSLSSSNIMVLAQTVGVKLTNTQKEHINGTIFHNGLHGFTALAKVIAQHPYGAPMNRVKLDIKYNKCINLLRHNNNGVVNDKGLNKLRITWLDRLISAIDERLALLCKS